MARYARIMRLSILLLGVEVGLGGCPCISADLGAYRTADGSKLSFVSGGGSYTLPLGYGTGCNQHDVGSEPLCSGDDPGCSPSWCDLTWCWVDKANCDETDVQASAYFPGGPHYSYATCGSVDAFSGFYSLLSTTPRTTGLALPLVSATSCMYLTSSTASCGDLVLGRTTFNNDWCAVKQEVESGSLSFSDVLKGRTLDVTVIPADDAYWVEDAAGGARLGGLVGDILNWMANDAGFTYKIHAVPKPPCMGYPSWERWTIDQASRADLVAQWTTDSWQRQSKGVSWPFHHLNLDHVLVVRASGPSVSIEDWEAFVGCASCGSVCVYGGIVQTEMTALLGARRVLPPPTGYGETQSHKWAASQLRSGGCAAYVQPKDRAERMLAQFSAARGCDLRMRQPAGLPARGGGFAAILPFARELEARAVNESASSGAASCTDIAIAAFTRVLQKMHVDVYQTFRAAELEAIQSASESALQCKTHECESGELDLGAACFRCDERTIDCKQRYMIAVRPRHYRASTNLSASGVLSVGIAAGAEVSAWQCTMPEACIGTLAAANASAWTVSAADTGGNGTCAPGHGGVLCAVCDAGYRRTLRKCEPCNKADPSDLAGGASAATTQVAAISAVMLMVFCLLVGLYLRTASSLTRGRLADVVTDASQPKAPRAHFTRCEFVLVLLGKLPWSGLATLAKILLGYVQCMSIFYRLDHVDWPRSFLAFLAWLDLTSLMAVLESVTLTDCMAARPLGLAFEFGLSLGILPTCALLIFLLALLNALTTPTAANGQGRLTLSRLSTPQAWEAFEWVMLLCYPLVSRVCFQLLDCIEYDGGVLLLRVEPTIACGSEEHLGLRTVALACISLFCVGLPVVVVLMSYRAFGPWGTTHRRAFVRLLTDSYRPQVFYFEAVDLIRKLLLSSVAVVTFPRTRMQLFFGAVCAGLAVVTFVGVRPYRESWCNFLQGLACLQILLTFVAASVFIRTDVDAAESDNEIAGIMLILLNVLCLLSVPWYAYVLWVQARRIAAEMSQPPDPSRPAVWLTSNCLSSDRLRAEFVRLAVIRKTRRPLDPEDADGRSATTTATEDLQALLTKYADVLATIKVLHLNDSLFYRDPEGIRKNRAKGVKGGGMYFWDNALVEECGFRRENITTAQILNKPWLFNKPAEEGMHSKQEPNVADLDPADEARYNAALDRTRSVYDQLTADAAAAASPAAASPGANGAQTHMNCADVLAKESLRLDDKYERAFTKWCEQTFGEVDIVCGQGGDVVMTNMAYQANQPFAKALVVAVRSNRCLYISHSAGTMVTAKSMEMTGEIKPGWLEAFAVNKRYLPLVMFNAVDLSGGGVSNSVLGALPLFNTPFAMRPHYSDAWVDQVLSHNQMAAEECGHETGIEISTHLIQQSGDNVGCALQLLDIVGQANSRYQMRPIFVPLRDGKVMEMQIVDGKEVFRALDGTLPPSVANPFGKSIAVREKGTFHSNLGWTDAVKVNRGAGSDMDDASAHPVPTRV